MGKASFHAAYWHAGQAVDLGSFPNDAAGFGAWQTALAQRAEGQAPRQVVVEPTGGYHLPLVHFAVEQGWAISVVNPKQVRDWGKGTGWRAKTDKQDAALLAAYGAACQPAAQALLPTEVSELDSLLHRRTDLEQMLRAERNRLEGLRQRPGVAPTLIPSLERTIAALETELALIERAIGDHLKAHPPLAQQASLLRTVPGVGVKTCLPLLVTLTRWHTLTNGQGTPKGLTAFVGLDPQPFQSGTSVFKRPGISKMGDKFIRRCLYLAALGGVRGANPLRDFYQHLVGRHKPKRLALVAAARKLLLWAWAVHRSGQPFDPDRAAAKPPKPLQAA
jgi:transposase